jgi:hypothetical protein
MKTYRKKLSKQQQQSYSASPSKWDGNERKAFDKCGYFCQRNSFTFFDQQQLDTFG